MIDYFRSALMWIIGITILVIFFPVVFIIWLAVLPFDRQRKVIHRLLVWQSMLVMKVMPSWKVITSGKEKLNKNEIYVIISNHQSLLDILLINTTGLRFRWISKAENMKVPFIGWYLRMAGYLTVDRNNDESKAELLALALKYLKDGTSLAFFPEGTRIKAKAPGYFKRGAFQMAITASVPILPVVIEGTAEILPKHGMIVRGLHKIGMRILDPVYPGDFGTDDPDDLASKFRLMVAEELNKSRI